LSICLHWPYLGSYIMIVVDECHDFGCFDVYLIVRRCFAYEQFCDVMCCVLCDVCGGVVA